MVTLTSVQMEKPKPVLRHSGKLSSHTQSRTGFRSRPPCSVQMKFPQGGRSVRLRVQLRDEQPPHVRPAGDHSPATPRQHPRLPQPRSVKLPMLLLFQLSVSQKEHGQGKHTSLQPCRRRGANPFTRIIC